MKWDCSELEFDDLPNVQDVFRQANEDIFVGSILEREHQASLLRGKAKKTEKQVRKALHEMCAMKPRKKSTPWIIFARESFEVDYPEATIERHMCSALVKKGDFVKAEDVLDFSEKAFTQAGLERVQARIRGADIRSKDHPVVYSLELTSWERALSYKVWLGGGFCLKEQYEVLADIFCEMTRFGYSSRKVRRGQDKALAVIKQATNKAAKGKTMYSVELISKECGLKPAANDLEREYCECQHARADILNHNARVDWYSTWVALANDNLE